MLKPHPLDDCPTLDDLFNFLAQYPRAQRKALPAVVRKGDKFYPIHDITLSGASLEKGTVAVDVGFNKSLIQADEQSVTSTPCFMIG